jgi:peroxiredoxin
MLADTGGTVGRAYGVLGGGPLGWLRGLLRWNARVTFVIDANGVVAHVIRHPDVRGHAGEILQLLR